MPKIIGKSVRVVEHGGSAIDEFVGNVGTKEDTLSVAVVKVASPCSEPWLTLHYDEWICVTKGLIEMHSENCDVLTVKEGETVFVAAGERFRPVFPLAGTEYVPVCFPAFRPDRCIREEEEEGSPVSDILKSLHNGASVETKEVPVQSSDTDDSEEVLFHMAQRELYESVVAKGEAYFPPTFEADGMFTHATAVPTRLITTANHFYTGTKGDWICLQLSRSALHKLGIVTKFEEPKPVGETDVGEAWNWICPHIFGGIPTGVPGVVTSVYEMQRDAEGKFLSISGVTDNES